MKSVLPILFLFLMSQQVFSQNRAPSCWLNYQDNFTGDILINTVRVPSPSPTYTYYCTMQWNAGTEAGGYCGMQESPGGRNFIYSLWDPLSTTDSIKVAYTHPGTDAERFGGEGTGLKSLNFDIGWERNQWYSFVTRAWDDHAHSFFGYWVYDHTDSAWYHLVTMDYPVSNVRFYSRTGSFIEDWLGNGWFTREVHHKEGWKRKTSDSSWYVFASALFEKVNSDAGTVNYRDSYDGGVNAGFYFMKSGGSIAPVTNASGSMLYLPNSKIDHGFEAGGITSFHATIIDSSQLGLSWEVDSSRPPQFSFYANIYDNPAFSGSPLLRVGDTIPHARNTSLDISTLPDDAEYYIRFYIRDIFDNPSDTLSGSFIKGTVMHIGERVHRKPTVHPNPFTDEINIQFHRPQENVEVRLINATGGIIYEGKYRYLSEIKIPVSAGTGICLLWIKAGSETITQKLFTPER